MNHLLGINGKAGSGKDTVADLLRSRRGYHSIAFADPLRAGITAMLALDAGHFEHPQKEQPLPIIEKSPRQLLQLLGTEWGRQMIHPDLWVMLAARRVADIRLRHPGANIVITDVRLDNEAAMIRELGGEIWMLTRPGAGTPHAHSSENGISLHHIARTIRNNGTLDELRIQVEAGVLDWLLPEPPRNNKPIDLLKKELKAMITPSRTIGA